MSRRAFLAILGAAIGTPAASAISARRKTFRIGYLHPTDAHDVAYTAFRAALGRAGYVVGVDTILEERFAQDDVKRLPALAAELVARHVDVIVAVSPTAHRNFCRRPPAQRGRRSRNGRRPGTCKRSG